MNLTTVQALYDHWALVAAAGLCYWWATPRLFKSVLSNGGGEIVRRIVREETADAVAGVRERLAALETRIADHLAARPS